MSEPTVRAAHRRDELEAMGIRVVKLGQQYRVVTSSFWAFLGLDRANTAPAPRTGRRSARPLHTPCIAAHEPEPVPADDEEDDEERAARDPLHVRRLSNAPGPHLAARAGLLGRYTTNPLHEEQETP